MSLDKWVKPDKKKQNRDKKGKPVKNVEQEPKNFKKYNLSCPKKSCNYQKTIMKKQLNEKDKICPRCNSEMKIKRV
ncbi:MAG: hypothetical protein JW891_17935 [Candidatus Lokiarchaeota archaeon]|nr:hypothetical protein [Candidatus Lokiarchaeota archaeon]